MNVALLALSILIGTVLLLFLCVAVYLWAIMREPRRHDEEERLNRHSEVTFDRKVHKVERRTDR